MPILLFPLRHVPKDEADDIYQLLADNNIEFYETNAGNWGISMPAFWLNNTEQEYNARELIYHYQQQRSTQQKEDYQKRLQSGEANGFLSNLYKQPLQSFILFTTISLIIYASVRLVLDFGY